MRGARTSLGGGNTDGMDAWYHAQKQRDQELKARRKEAEELLRGYRSTTVEAAFSPERKTPTRNILAATPQSAVSQLSETLDDPEHHHPRQILDESSGHDDNKTLPNTLPVYEEEQKHDDEPLTVWRHMIAPGTDFEPAPDRYHLYLSYACPGSHRVLLMRQLKGLQDVISVTILHPVWKLTCPELDKHRGWVFGNADAPAFSNTIGRGGPFPAQFDATTQPDPLHADSESIRDLYDACGDNAGKYTIPILYDKHHDTIVNNEASDISYMMNSSFNEFAQFPHRDLYQATTAHELQATNVWMAPLMIHGVYRCGFAKTQEQYQVALSNLCAAFDRADTILQKQRFLTGDRLTDADLRLFVSLVRFDEVYAVYFKANARLVVLTPALLQYCRDIYHLPGLAETVQMDHIKSHFYASHAEWNKYSIGPAGLNFLQQLQERPVGRAELSNTPDDVFCDVGPGEFEV